MASLVVLGGLLAGCAEESEPVGNGGTTGAGGSAGGGGASDVLPASEYCERAVEVFCPFYLRCGRIAEPDLEGCRRTFRESCQQLYAPRYAELAALGLLELSASGLAGCASFLGDVPCEHHLLDLEEPCRRIWRGLAPEGAPCSLSVESFVCDEATTCIIDTDLCGACEPAADPGESCSSERHCRYPSDCVDGLCVAASFPGEACGAEQPCIAGASCDAGQCVARSYVGVGASCDQAHRCAYRSSCISGSCALDALLGEACSATTVCASGNCDAASSECVPWLLPGTVCSDAQTCLSGGCSSNVCEPLTSECVRAGP